VDGKVFDRIDCVYDRYCTREGRKQLRANLEIYTRRRPIQKIAPGDTLRIIDDAQFEVVWSVDHWKTTQTTVSRSLGNAGYSADLSTAPLSETAPNQESSDLSWTLHWPEQNRWLGYNVDIKIEERN
jgi:hypothetical protein